MPCFKQEKSLQFCLSKQKKGSNGVAPKPVHVRPARFHGLFGVGVVSQHFIVDNKWTPQSLSDQFDGMAGLLSRHNVYKRYETKANRLRLLKLSKLLKTECNDGRAKLKNVSSADNLHKISNYLGNHIDMQRLYRRMPMHLIVDNINQRSFVLRKERDRLECRLGQLKHEYRDLLRERGKLENLIKYDNYVLEEETSRTIMKKIENSNVRLKAIRNINTAYHKMIKVLLQDEIFYEPILRSLDDDMNDQVALIKHILWLGMPAITKYKELNLTFQGVEEKARRHFQGVSHMFNMLQKPRAVSRVVNYKEFPSANPKRYVRETKSMEQLQVQLQSVQKTIKELKMVTLCSQAKEIYSQFKGQMENNTQLHRKIEHDRQSHYMLKLKMKGASVLRDALVTNLSDEEMNRLEYINILKTALNNGKSIEESTMKYIVDGSKMYILFRYPNSYLKLPLLKFELLDVYSVPPEIFEVDLEKLMVLLKHKIYKLMNAYKSAKMESELITSRQKYHNAFLESSNKLELLMDADHNVGISMGLDQMEENKAMVSVPNRKQIKAQSVKIVEDRIKRDECSNLA
ncbi:uncharacterized protein LOC111603417 isoform X2 [Drosophila hydei]|uniref:Uncharacterized protein LOC111603417 isoform X2 n=1 Tax=Drosophila hydei TaxID=7224 RepID=A0A6J1MC34_DROHY|nr:uncharacterized protein LOC111603417 isoform X2 [Drosophila hydei]